MLSVKCWNSWKLNKRKIKSKEMVSFFIPSERQIYFSDMIRAERHFTFMTEM